MTHQEKKFIGRFQVIREIGRGATATVYLASDPFSNSEVAIKVAHQDSFSHPVTGERFKKMFINESSLAGRLDHPHIVAGFDDDYFYIVMEYVPGTTLKPYCAPDNLLPVEDVMEIAFKCCNGLEYAHNQGLIHRDIKPANILTTGATHVMLSDFGTALLSNADTTQVLDAVGTPKYMSPEQIQGQELTHRSDIYSLGVVMYQLLSGRLPFDAKTQLGMIKEICSAEPYPLDQARPDLLQPIVEIVHKCIDKDPARRYRDCGELSAEITALTARLRLQKRITSDSQKFNLLKRLDFFHDFTDVDLWEVMRICKWHRFPAQTRLLREGGKGNSFFVIASGSASITRGSTCLNELAAGQCFGEMAYILGTETQRSANVISNSDITLVKIRPRFLQNASDRLQTKFNKTLLKVLAERLERTSLMVSVP
ncbi:MAG: serine/threonine-protein kinase [Candidatus Sedimenticola endophacoides]